MPDDRFPRGYRVQDRRRSYDPSPAREPRDDLESLTSPHLNPQQRGELVLVQQHLQEEFNEEGRKYTLAAIVTQLLPKLEAARKNYLMTGTPPQYADIISRQLQRAQEQFFAEVSAKLPHDEDGDNHRIYVQVSPEQEQKGLSAYWSEVNKLLQGDFLQAYGRVAERKNRIEQSPLYQYGYGNRAAITAATALPGLATLRMWYSTPLIMVGLAYVGYKFVHPFFQRRINDDVRHLAEFTVHQQKRINELAFEERRKPEQFQVKAVLDDLLPQLEITRMAGGHHNNFQKRVGEYMQRLHKDFTVARVLPEEHWLSLEGLITEEFLPRFSSSAVVHDKIERGNLFYRLLSHSKSSAVLTAAVLTPIYFLFSRALPLGGLDDLLMAGLFAYGGYHLPKMLNPGLESLQQLYDGLSARSGGRIEGSKVISRVEDKEIIQ